MKFANLDGRLKSALREDGAFRDVTTRRIPGVHRRTRAVLLAKSDGIFYGGLLVDKVFRLVKGRPRVSGLVKDGTRVRAGQVLALIQADTQALLAGERVLLNLLCHLGGVATLTHRYVNAVRGTSAQILDTRKTTPLWRDLEKAAVQAGGGVNHRFSLSDAILVKDNHRAFLKRVGLAPSDVYRRKDRKGKGQPTFVALEANTIPDVWDAIKARADIVLLDNMPLSRLKKAIVFVKAARTALDSPFPLIEVSGGVTIPAATRYARLGVDRISVGALTHSAPALDISLEVN